MDEAMGTIANRLDKNKRRCMIKNILDVNPAEKMEQQIGLVFEEKGESYGNNQ